MLKVKRIQLGKQAYRRLLKRVLERDGWRCQKCGSLKDLQVHHRKYRSRRGNDSLANLVTLCAYCHMEEHSQLSYSRAAAKQNEHRSAMFPPKAVHANQVQHEDRAQFGVCPRDR